MTIAIANSILGARDRFVEVLRDNLAAVLSTAEAANPGYPLPDPEVYITAPDDPVEVWRKFNVAECAVWVTRDGNSRYPQIYEGSGTTYAADQRTRFRVTAIQLGVGGYNLPERNGRELTQLEWLSDRAEIYRGALIDTLTQNLHDGSNVNGLSIAENGADATTFEIGPVGRCSIVIDVLQGVLIKGVFNG